MNVTRVVVTLAKQTAVAVAQFRHAARKRIATVFELGFFYFSLGFNEQEIQVIAEIELMARPRVQKIGDLEPGDAARPGEETALTIELLVLFPQDERRLLNDVVRVIQVPDQRMDVAEQSRLAALQLSGEIGVKA
jgi:hypothetical protein